MIDYDLRIEPLKTKKIILPFIKDSMERREANGLLILFSGQIDSYTVTKLSIEAVGLENIELALISDVQDSRLNSIILGAKNFLDIPSEKINCYNTQKVLQQFNELEGLLPEIKKDDTKNKQYNIGSMILQAKTIRKIIDDKTYNVIVSTDDKSDSFIRKMIVYSNSQKRLKIMLAYLLSERYNLLLVSKTNKTEFLTGFFTPFGYDHGGDIAPLGDLYRTQVLQIADYLDVPKEIRGLAYSDIESDIINKYQFFFGLESSDVDKILIRLQAGLTYDQIANVLSINIELVKRVNEFFEIALLQRNTPHIPKIH